MKTLLGRTRPTISGLWATTARLPMGDRVFSKLIGRTAAYSGTIGARVLELADGHSRVQLRDRPAVRNHLGSIHAVALMNLGELATGLAVMHAVDGRGRGIVTHLGMDYQKKARGTITATCDLDVPLTPGTHDLEVTGELRDEQGDLVARVAATWRLDITSP